MNVIAGEHRNATATQKSLLQRFHFFFGAGHPVDAFLVQSTGFDLFVKRVFD